MMEHLLPQRPSLAKVLLLSSTYYYHHHELSAYSISTYLLITHFRGFLFRNSSSKRNPRRERRRDASGRLQMHLDAHQNPNAFGGHIEGPKCIQSSGYVSLHFGHQFPGVLPNSKVLERKCFATHVATRATPSVKIATGLTFSYQITWNNSWRRMKRVRRRVRRSRH